MTFLSLALSAVPAAMVGAQPAVQATNPVARDGFESEFPGNAWTVSDNNATFDDDFWGLSTARAATGAGSLWAAGFGDRVDEVELIDESFESGMMPGGWQSYDEDTYYDVDYWGATTYKANTGTYSMWVAQEGDNEESGGCEKICEEGANGFPDNRDLHRYDSNSNTYLVVDLDLSEYTYADMTYSFWMDIEQNYDYFYAVYLDGNGWHLMDQRTGRSDGWEQGSLHIPKAATQAGFFFDSDEYVIAEGVYVDDVTIIATRTAENAELAMYDDGMDALVTRPVSLAGYETAQVDFSYWLDSETDHDFLTVEYFRLGSWNVAATYTGLSAGWKSASVGISVEATQVGFRFQTDGDERSEGAYIDDVSINGFVSPLDCHVTVNAIDGIEAITVFGFRVDVDGGLRPLSYEWTFTDGSTSDLPLAPMLFSDAATIGARVEVEDVLGQRCEVIAPDVVVHHDLSTITVTPNWGEMSEGATMSFGAYDARGHHAAFAWSVQPPECGEFSMDGSAARFAASSSAGGLSCEIRAGLEGHAGTASVAVLHDFAQPVVAPAEVSVVEGTSQVFRSYDSFGHESDAMWTSSCGPIQDGLRSQATLQVRATGGKVCAVSANVNEHTATSMVTVLHDTHDLTLTPLAADIVEGGSLSFSAADVYGHASAVTWSVSPEACGSFTYTESSSTTFEVAMGAGGKTCTVRATARDGFKEAAVAVGHDYSSGAAAADLSSVAEGHSVAVSAVDAHGHPMSMTWAVTPSSCGAMEPQAGTTSTFTPSGSAAGAQCTVTATGHALTLRTMIPVTHSPATVLEVTAGSAVAGASLSASARATDSGGHAVDAATVAWTGDCGAPSPPTGERTTIAIGADKGGSTCTLTATFGGLTKTTTISVNFAGPFVVTVNAATAALRPGETTTVSVVVTDSGGRPITPDQVEWVAPCGMISGEGASVTYTAGSTAGPQCQVTANIMVGGETAGAAVTLGAAAGGDMTMTLGLAGAGVAALAAVGAMVVMRRKKSPEAPSEAAPVAEQK